VPDSAGDKGRFSRRSIIRGARVEIVSLTNSFSNL
jgi:hypothetical protein